MHTHCCLNKRFKGCIIPGIQYTWSPNLDAHTRTSVWVVGGGLIHGRSSRSKCRQTLILWAKCLGLCHIFLITVSVNIATWISAIVSVGSIQRKRGKDYIIRSFLKTKQNSTTIYIRFRMRRSFRLQFFLSQSKDMQRVYKIGTHFPPETL